MARKNGEYPMKLVVLVAIVFAACCVTGDAMANIVMVNPFNTFSNNGNTVQQIITVTIYLDNGQLMAGYSDCFYPEPVTGLSCQKSDGSIITGFQEIQDYLNGGGVPISISAAQIGEISNSFLYNGLNGSSVTGNTQTGATAGIFGVVLPDDPDDPGGAAPELPPGAMQLIMLTLGGGMGLQKKLFRAKRRVQEATL